jgi:uncharacterized membrane protein
MEAMLKAVSDLGFTPSQHGAISAEVRAERLKFRASMSDASVSRGQAGTLRAQLKPTGGPLQGVTVTVSSEGAGVEASAEVGEVKGAKSLEVQVTVGEKAEPGEHELIVVVKSDAGEVRLRLPVRVE